MCQQLSISTKISLGLFTTLCVGNFTFRGKKCWQLYNPLYRLNNNPQCQPTQVSSIQKLSPLQTKEGVDNEVNVILWGAALPCGNHFSKRKIIVGPITRKTTEAFKTKLLWTDWSFIKTSRVDLSIQIYTDYMNESANQFFPAKEITVKSTDKKWSTKEIKRNSRRRKRCFKGEGRSGRWQQMNTNCNGQVRCAKRNLVETVKQEAGGHGSRKFFQTIKKLWNVENPGKWKISGMFPGKNNADIAREAAGFFNRISQEYAGVDKPPHYAPGSLHTLT